MASEPIIEFYIICNLPYIRKTPTRITPTRILLFFFHSHSVFRADFKQLRITFCQ